MTSLMHFIATFDLSINQFKGEDEFLLDDLSEELLEFEGYFQFIERYFSKYQRISIDSDRSYGGIFISFNCNNTEDIAIIERLVTQYKKLANRKYNLEYIYELWSDSRNRSKKFKTGSERDYFIKRSLNINKKKMVRVC